LSQRVADITDFLMQLDGLKSVNRRTYINGGERRENSAEHSWHLAMACWAFAELLDEDFDTDLLIKMALVHDLGEMEAGDTFLYSQHRDLAHVAERKCVEKIGAHAGNPIGDLVAIWEQQETGTGKEVSLLKVIDRLLPFLHNMNSEGRAWRENGIHKNQVLQMHAFIEQANPEVYAWFLGQLQHAVAEGWLADN
jgi:putative hydrolase of HD superfamily